MGSSLTLHNPKFDSKLVSRGALINLPEPEAMGLRHKPVPHCVLVDAIADEIDRRGFNITREQLALGSKGQAIFGVMDLTPKAEMVLTETNFNRERGMSFGFRSSTNQVLSIQAVAGTRVFVCDNLALSGNMIAIQRKSTTRLDLGEALASGFDKFLQHSEEITISIERLAGTVLSDSRAKEMICDLFMAESLPTRLFDDVTRFYFKPLDSQPDCQPRSLWGLHNACTRAAKDLPPASHFRASVRLGRAFDLTSKPIGDTAEAVEGEIV